MIVNAVALTEAGVNELEQQRGRRVESLERRGRSAKCSVAQERSTVTEAGHFFGQQKHEDSGPGDNITFVIQRERANENEVTVHDVEEAPICLKSINFFF